jgi:hypothetical protein
MCPACQTKFPICIVTGRPLMDLSSVWTCKKCHHRAYEQVSIASTFNEHLFSMEVFFEAFLCRFPSLFAGVTFLKYLQQRITEPLFEAQKSLLYSKYGIFFTKYCIVCGFLSLRIVKALNILLKVCVCNFLAKKEIGKKFAHKMLMKLITGHHDETKLSSLPFPSQRVKPLIHFLFIF